MPSNGYARHSPSGVTVWALPAASVIVARTAAAGDPGPAPAAVRHSGARVLTRCTTPAAIVMCAKGGATV